MINKTGSSGFTPIRNLFRGFSSVVPFKRKEHHKKGPITTKQVAAVVLTILLLISQSLSSLVSTVYAASSPWIQTDWSGGSGQTSWSDATKFDSSSSVTTSTAGQATLTNTEKFSNTGFESDLSSWSGAQSYTLQDQFTTARSAGAVNGTSAEPTGGTRTVTDTSSKISITGGLLNFATGGTSNDGIWYSSLARAAGKTLLAKVIPSDTNGVINVGWDTDTSGAVNDRLVFAASGVLQIVPNAGTAITVGAYTATTYYIAGDMRSTGFYWFIKGGAFTNWTLLWITAAGTAAGIPSINIGSTTSIFTADDVLVPATTYIPVPVVSDGFSASTTDGSGNAENNGPVGTSWTGSTWTVAGGSVSNTPTQGSEIWTDGGLEIWTNSTTLTNWSNALAGTSSVNQETTTIHGGSNAARLDVDASNSGAGIYQTIAGTIGKWYMESGWIRSSASGKTARLGMSGGAITGPIVDPGTTYTQYFQSNRATSGFPSPRADRVSAASASIYLDDLSVKALTLSTLFRSVDAGSADILAETAITRTAGTQSGLVLNLDSASSPSNFIIVYEDGNGNINVDEAVAGVYTNKASTAVTYSAGAVLRAVRYGTSLDVYYNNAKVGSTLTMAANTNTKHGLFSTYSGNTFDNFVVWNRSGYTDAPFEDLSSVTRDTGTKYAGTASAKLVAGATDANFTQSINAGDTNTYNLSAYAYTNGSAVTASDLSLLVNGSIISTTYTSVGGGWYQLTGTTAGTASSVAYGVRVKSGKTVYVDNMSLNNYASSGTVTSSIFDAGWNANLGTLTYTATTPSNTSVSVKMRTSSSSSMSGATAFASCTAISSGTDISSNTCVTDGHRYIQYLLTLSNTSTAVTPTFADVSLTFANAVAPTGSININSDSTYTNSRSVTLTLAASDDVDVSSSLQMETSEDSGFSGASYEAFSTSKSFTLSTTDGTKTVYARFKDADGNVSPSYSDTIVMDTTAPASFDLDSPGDNSYSSSERPSFKWKATTDSSSGLAKYVLEIDNPSIGSGQPSGDFTINDIPTSRTTDYETNKYLIHYENFSDSDSTNNYISVYTKSHSDWSSNENDGKLREGRISWKVKAVDNAGNETSSSRTLFVDRTSPSTELTQINSTPFTASNFSTTDKTPTIYGKITDPLAGGDPSQIQDENGPRVASGPKQVEIKIEKKEGLTYKLHTLYTINMDKSWYTCDNSEVTDNTKQKCDKYLPFEYLQRDNLDLGTYRITLMGKDKADNSSQTSFTLRVTTLSQITQQPSDEVSKPDDQGNITIPTEETTPNIIQQAGEKAVGTTSNFISALFNGIGNALRFVFNGIGSVVAYIGNSIGNGLAFIFDKIGNTYDSLARRSPGVIRNILLAIENGFNIAQNAAAQLAIWEKRAIANIAFAIGERTDDISHGFGTAFIQFGYLFVPEPTKIYDVQVVVLSPTSAKISWKTNHPANGKINYGLDETYPLDVQTEKRTNDHEFTLTNLSPGTEYHFEVMSQNKNYVYDANRKFITPAN